MSTPIIPQDDTETPEERHNRKIAEETRQLLRLQEINAHVGSALQTYVEDGCTDVKWFNAKAPELTNQMREALAILDRLLFHGQEPKP